MTDELSLTGLLLLTATTLAYGIGPFITDMNRTHLTHPQWIGHARFHLVWSACSQLAVSFLALWLLWWPGEHRLERAHLAALIGACMNSGFLVALIFRKRFGGTLSDPGGIPPIAGRVDGNIVAVFLILLLLAAGWLAL